MTPNDRLTMLVFKLITNWRHIALPDGEYPQTIAELTSAYPDLLKTHEVEIRKSQYTGRVAVMCRVRPSLVAEARRAAFSNSKPEAAE